MEQPRCSLELLARTERLPAVAYRVLAEHAHPFIVADALSGLSGTRIWAELICQVEDQTFDRMIDQLSSPTNTFGGWWSFTPFLEVMSKRRLTGEQWKKLGDAVSGVPERHRRGLAQTAAEMVVSELGVAGQAARAWVPAMTTQNRFRFVLDHPGDVEADLAALDFVNIRNVGGSILWLVAMWGKLRPDAAKVAADLVVHDMRDGYGVHDSTWLVRLSLLCGLGVWNEETVRVAVELVSTSPMRGRKWFRPDRLLCDPTVPAPVAAAICDRFGVVDTWSAKQRGLSWDELVPLVRDAFTALAVGPRRAWHVLGRFVDGDGVIDAFVAAGQPAANDRHYTAQLTATAAWVSGGTAGLALNPGRMAEVYEQAARLVAPVPLSADDKRNAGMLVEACGGSEAAWRLAVTLLEDGGAVDLKDVAALVSVAVTPTAELLAT